MLRPLRWYHPDTGTSVGFGVDLAVIQARLNALGTDPQLTVDGVTGPATEAAIEAFQSSHGLTPDGVVGPLTLAALGLTSAPVTPTPTDGNSIVAVRGIEKTGNPFRAKLIAVAKTLGVDPDWLATVISFESAGTFSPAIQNKDSKATGLIQFLPSTARGLHTTIDALQAMTDVQQLDWVYKYLSQWQGRMHSLNDTYLAVFMPSQMGKSSDSVVASEGSAVYEQNPFDTEGKGYFTVGDITSAIHGVYNAGVNHGRVSVTTVIAGGAALLLTAIGAGTYFLLKGKGML